MFNKHDIKRNELMLEGKFSKCGYDWWWHSFTAINEKTKEEKPFYIEFFVCNNKYKNDNPTFGRLNEIPSYLMVNVGTWGSDHRQLHRFFGFNKVDIHKKAPFSVLADDCYLDETSTRGEIHITEDEAKAHPEYMSDFGDIKWNLKIEKDIAFNVGYGASTLFRKIKAFQMFWHAEGMKSYFEGEIIYNGEKYIVSKDTCYGYSDKNWGSDFTSPWVWLSSNNLYSKKYDKKLENSVFDIGGGCPKIYFIPLKRKLLSAFYYEGKCYEFNFSKFWTFTRTKFECKETEDEIIWHVTQKTWTNRMETDIRCKKSDMLLINYEAPNGKKLHNRLWNGGNGEGVVKLYHKNKLVDEIICKNIGCEYGEYDK